MTDEDRCPGTNRNDEQCGHPPGWGTDHVGEGRCKFHGGASTGPKTEEGKAKVSKNAITHGAYSESFVSDLLTDEEIERVEQAQELLDTPEGAQNHARLMAAIAVEQYRRSGDEAFLRRYEAICDKAGIFPADEIDHGASDGLISILSGEYNGDR